MVELLGGAWMCFGGMTKKSTDVLGCEEASLAVISCGKGNGLGAKGCAVAMEMMV